VGHDRAESKIFYRTATSFNGFIADEDNSVGWLFGVDSGGQAPPDVLAGVGVIVVGSTTYEWVVQAMNLLAEPQKWQHVYGARPMFVFTTRSLDAPEGADVRFVRGAVGDHLAAIRTAAGEQDVCVSGGGDLAGQFLDIGALDQIVLGIAPVALAGGAPLFPRRVEADRLHVTDVSRRGQFVNITYAVGNPG
jgi:dihydrofolate reductase